MSDTEGNPSIEFWLRKINKELDRIPPSLEAVLLPEIYRRMRVIEGRPQRPLPGTGPFSRQAAEVQH